MRYAQPTRMRSGGQRRDLTATAAVGEQVQAGVISTLARQPQSQMSSGHGGERGSQGRRNASMHVS